MRRVKGSATIEMAYIMPVVLFAFVALIYILFYLHDKNIISGAGYETAVVGCQKLRWEEEDVEGQMEKLFRERIRGKLIFFSYVDVEIVCGKEMVMVKAEARKNRMRIHTEQRCQVSEPEKFIRNLRRIHGNEI